MSEPVVFISGANRGIGFGMAQKFVEQGYHVVAGYRSVEKSQALFAASAPDRSTQSMIHPFKIDVTDESDAADLHDFIADRFGRLDILINNAGILLEGKRRQSLNDLDVVDLSLTFNVNVGGTHLVTRNLYPLLLPSAVKAIVNISSGMASLANNKGGSAAYRISKTALNMLTSNQAIAYNEDGVTVVCVHPGWVQSDMGGPDARLTIEESADHLTTLITGLTFEDTGRFLNYDGEPLPW